VKVVRIKVELLASILTKSINPGGYERRVHMHDFLIITTHKKLCQTTAAYKSHHNLIPREVLNLASNLLFSLRLMSLLAINMWSTIIVPTYLTEPLSFLLLKTSPCFNL
jgi:hypothetical protein